MLWDGADAGVLQSSLWKEGWVVEGRLRRAPDRAGGFGCCVQVSSLGRFCAKALSCGFLGGGGSSLCVTRRAGTQAPHSSCFLENCTPGYFIAGFFLIQKALHLVNPEHGCHSTGFTFITRNAEDVWSPPPAPFPPASRAAQPRQILVVNY